MQITLRICILLALLLPTHALAQGGASLKYTGGVTLSVPSVAEPDGIQALIHNPAGLGTLRRWEARVYNAQMDGAAGEGTAFLWGTPVFGRLSLGVGYEHLRTPGHNYGRSNFGLGLRLHHTLNMGLVWRHIYEKSNAPLYDLDLVDLGFLFRPTHWLSLGATVHNLNAPSEALRAYTGSVAIRPGSSRVTAEFGATIFEDSKDIDGLVRLRFEPIRGLEIAAHVKLQPRDGEVGLQLGTSLALHFGAAGVESGVTLLRAPNTSTEYAGFTVGARLSSAHYPALIRRTHKTIQVDMVTLGEQSRPNLTGGGGTFTHLLYYLDRLRKDDTVAGVLFRDKGSRYGWAQAQEIRRVITALKAAGKRITVYLQQGDLRHLYQYSGADEIFLNPATGLRITGLKSTLSYYKDALAKLRVDTQWVRYGRYKSYPESFMRTEPSNDDLKVRNSLLDGLFEQITSGIAADRKLSKEQMLKIVDQGPYVSKEALDAKLVDKLLFWDQVKANLPKGSYVVLAGSKPAQARADWGRRKRIAVIVVEGQIIEGKSRKVPLLGTRMVGSDTINAAVKAAAANPNVVGILLRINTPGGSSVASDLMHRQIQQAAKKKPVVASFSNVAASGGYYLAMGAKEIFAEDGTITGSIGIFTGKPAFGRLYQTLGIGRATLTRGKRADIFGQDKPWSEDELLLMTQKLKVFYDLFLQRVADNRKMTLQEVDTLAQGRVWLGSQARKHKLVDTEGGVLAAIARIRELAGVDEDTKIRLSFLPHSSLKERIRRSLGIQALLQAFGGMEDALRDAYPFLAGYQAGEPLALMPFTLHFD
jgi:protease-4